MDENIKCECGNDKFWFFGDRVRCYKCYTEYRGNDEMRFFVKGGYENWHKIEQTQSYEVPIKTDKVEK